MVDRTIQETGAPYHTIRAVLPVLTGDGTAEETAINHQKQYTGTSREHHRLLWGFPGQPGVHHQYSSLTCPSSDIPHVICQESVI